MSDVNRTLTSLLLSHTICRHFWRIVVIEVSYILEWIFVFLEAQLVAHLIVELLFLNVFADLGFVSTYCIYVISFRPEHSPSVFVFYVCMSLKYHERTLPFEIPHEICYGKFGRYRHKHMDMVWHRVCFYYLYMLVIA